MSLTPPLPGYLPLPFMGKISRDAVETVGRGMYRIEGSEDGDTVLLARIDNGDELPHGFEEQRFRADGKRLVIARMPDDEHASGPFWERGPV